MWSLTGRSSRCDGGRSTGVPVHRTDRYCSGLYILVDRCCSISCAFWRTIFCKARTGVLHVAFSVDAVLRDVGQQFRRARIALPRRIRGGRHTIHWIRVKLDAFPRHLSPRSRSSRSRGDRAFGGLYFVRLNVRHKAWESRMLDQFTTGGQDLMMQPRAAHFRNALCR